jgi:hypothetical protein
MLIEFSGIVLFIAAKSPLHAQKDPKAALSQAAFFDPVAPSQAMY